MSSEQIPVETMRAHIADGTAIPLLDSTAPPCLWEQQWWGVPQGETAYCLVSDEAHVSKLTDLLARKQASQQQAGGRS